MSDLAERLRENGEALATEYGKRDRETTIVTMDEELIFIATCQIDEAADALASQATLIAELQGEVERALKVISDHAEIYAEDGGGPTNAAITKAIGLIIRDIAALKGGLNGK